MVPLSTGHFTLLLRVKSSDLLYPRSEIREAEHFAAGRGQRRSAAGQHSTTIPIYLTLMHMTVTGLPSVGPSLLMSSSDTAVAVRRQARPDPPPYMIDDASSACVQLGRKSNK